MKRHSSCGNLAKVWPRRKLEVFRDEYKEWDFVLQLGLKIINACETDIMIAELSTLYRLQKFVAEHV